MGYVDVRAAGSVSRFVTEHSQSGKTDRPRGINYYSWEKKFLTAHVPEPYLKTLNTARAWKETMPTNIMSVTVAVTTVLSVLYLSALTLIRRRPFVHEKRLLAFMKFTVIGTIINAAVCGYPRQQIDIRLGSFGYCPWSQCFAG
jgi:hypothetical protein